jgi:TetR/AcrR family transcriptional regulator, mexJK operon transcriptional repressor
MTVRYGHIALHNEEVNPPFEETPMTPAQTVASPKREERRDAIVQIAKEIFLAEGYSATSMATIAARVGGSKGTLYNYFASKELLFEAVVQEFCERNAAVLSGLDVEAGDFRAALRQFGGQILRLMLTDDVIAMHRLIAAEAGRFPEIGAAYYAAGVRRGKERLFARFSAAMEAGHIRRADPMVAAQHFFDLCLSGLHRHRLWNIGPMPTEAQIDANVDNAVATFLDGYRAG